MRLSEQEKSRISELAARVEARTGIQVLAVAADKSDVYPEIPWKAFSLGASLAALALAVGATMRPGWNALPFVVSAATALGAGLMLALATIFIRPWARAFLADHRAATETTQYARSLFLERGLSRTRSRNAVLILASQFERRAAIVADTGVIDRVSQSDLDKVSAAMDAGLKGGSAPAALASGLSALEALFLERGFAAVPGGGDDIAEEFLEAEGPKS